MALLFVEKDILKYRKIIIFRTFTLSQISYLPLRLNNCYYNQGTAILICILCKVNLALGTANITKHFHVICIFLPGQFPLEAHRTRSTGI